MGKGFNVVIGLVVVRAFTARGRVYEVGAQFDINKTSAATLIARGVCRLASKAERAAEWEEMVDRGRRNARRGYVVER